MKEYAKMVKNTFNYTGRTRRREFWVAVLINGVISYLLNALTYFVATAVGDCLYVNYANYTDYASMTAMPTMSMATTLANIPGTIFAIFVFITSLSLWVRRFHDAGFAAWVYALCVAGTCCCGIGLIAMFVISCFNSKDANQWGENPKLENPDEYTNSTSIIVSVVAFVLSLVIYFAAYFSNMALDPTALAF